MYYSLNNTDWSTSLPQATDVDTYTVYYKVVGDFNHKDFTPENNVVEVSITKVSASIIEAPTSTANK